MKEEEEKEEEKMEGEGGGKENGRGGGGRRGEGREGKFLLCKTELNFFLFLVLTPSLRRIDIYAKSFSKCSLIFTLYCHI